MFEHLADLSLDTLRVFEAAARLRSFTAAAWSWAPPSRRSASR
jgi:hypothetical protein